MSRASSTTGPALASASGIGRAVRAGLFTSHFGISALPFHTSLPVVSAMFSTSQLVSLVLGSIAFILLLVFIKRREPAPVDNLAASA